MTVSVRVSPPLSFIHRQSGAFRRELENLEPLWDRFEEELGAIGQERFDTRGYGEWPALAASTLAQKAAHGFPLEPLIRTYDLRESLTDADSTFSARDRGPQRFVWGTDIEYAEYHQDGTDKMPARKVLDIRVEDRQRLEREQVSWLNEVARNTWGRI